jgi:hypothetical protein
VVLGDFAAPNASATEAMIARMRFSITC